MKKRIYCYLFVGITLFSAVGCTTKQTNTQEVPSPTKSSSFFASAKEKEKKEEVVVLEGLCEVLEKKDTSKEASYNSFHRMASRHVGVETSLFCIDSDTGVVYFANKGKDGYLYRMKEGKVELAVAMPVKEIYTYEGSVYFMVENYEKYELKDMHNGDIYCYTPSTGTVQLIYPAGEIEGSTDHKLTVTSDGIYFSYRVYKESESDDSGSAICYHRYLAFGEKEPVADTKSMTTVGWENYCLDFPYIDNAPKFALINRTDYLDTKEVSAKTFRYCVVGDNLYSVGLGSTKLFCLNLKTGEEIQYDLYEVAKEAHTDIDGEVHLSDKMEIFNSFLVMEKEIWLSGPSELYHLDLESGEMQYYRLVKGTELDSYVIEALYTDGKQLYAMTCSGNQTEKSFHHILTEEVTVRVTWRAESALQVESLVEESH